MENKIEKSDVLFQKLGNVWYVFSDVNGELLYSSLPEGMDPRSTDMELYEVIQNHIKMVSGHKNNSEPEQSL